MTAALCATSARLDSIRFSCYVNLVNDDHDDGPFIGRLPPAAPHDALVVVVVVVAVAVVVVVVVVVRVSYF